MIRLIQLQARLKKRVNREGELVKSSSEERRLPNRQILHRAIYGHLQQGWQVQYMDKSGAKLVKSDNWDQRLFVMGLLMLPLLGLGLLFWLLALLNGISGGRQQLWISMERLQQGKSPLRGALTHLQRSSLLIFGLAFGGWMAAALPIFFPGSFQPIIPLPEELNFVSREAAGFRQRGIIPLAGISPFPMDDAAAQAATSTATASLAAVRATPTRTPLMPLAPTATATITPTPTQTATTRPDPNDWKNWPVIPQFSENWIAIYQRGISLGNNPQAFSVVGDCQSVPYLFMGMYDGGWYSPDSLSEELQLTVEFFAGSFGRYAMTIIDGANAASELSRGWANRNYCDIDESPLACELRLNKPSFVIINIGTHWSGRNGEYMRTIIETILETGAVPILATKADNLEGDFSINREIAQLASDYDIPLWNLWRAVQDLPGYGLDPYRQGGYMYLTPEGLEARRLSALKVLDTLRQAVD